MRALILAGGLGSRLRPFTFVIPKPLVPVGECPIIELLIRQLSARGFDRITLSVGYQAPLIEAFCGDGSRWDVPIDYVRESEPLGTAGCLSLIEDLGDEALLVMNGDILTDLDFADAYGRHDPAHGATILANRRQVQIEFGVLERDEQGHLKGYREKPTFDYQVSMGINVLSADAIREFVVPGERLDMPQLMTRIQNAGRIVNVVPTDAYWLDMGRMADLEGAQRIIESEPQRFLPT